MLPAVTLYAFYGVIVRISQRRYLDCTGIYEGLFSLVHLILKLYYCPEAKKQPNFSTKIFSNMTTINNRSPIEAESSVE